MLSKNFWLPVFDASATSNGGWVFCHSDPLKEAATPALFCGRGDIVLSQSNSLNSVSCGNGDTVLSCSNS